MQSKYAYFDRCGRTVFKKIFHHQLLFVSSKLFTAITISARWLYDYVRKMPKTEPNFLENPKGSRNPIKHLYSWSIYISIQIWIPFQCYRRGSCEENHTVMFFWFIAWVWNFVFNIGQKFMGNGIPLTHDPFKSCLIRSTIKSRLKIKFETCSPTINWPMNNWHLSLSVCHLLQSIVWSVTFSRS